MCAICADSDDDIEEWNKGEISSCMGGKVSDAYTQSPAETQAITLHHIHPSSHQHLTFCSQATHVA